MNSTLPLSGIKVLDLSRVLAGPLCTMMLGDLGADVIKVERPGTGDETRGWGPPFDDHGHSAYFLSINRNKLGLAIDLTKPTDVDLLRLLAADADVVIENFLPGVLSRYGIDAESIMAQSARLVWCTISGFGPESTRPGYDFVVQAECGWMAITGPEAGPPYRSGVAFADVITGKDAAAAILAALVGRSASSLPAQRHVHISLQASATAALVNVAQNALVSGKEAARWGNGQPNLVPYQLFEASDRPLVIAVGSDAQWLKTARVLGLDDLADDSSLTTNAGRLARRSEIVGRIAECVRTATAQHWVDALDRQGVPCGVVRGVLDALRDVPASARTGVAPATGGQVRRPPPGIDEHGTLIRANGWSAFDLVPILP